MTAQNLESNFWKYAILLISNKRIFIAILGAFYLTIPDVTAKTIGLIMLISEVAGFILEIPSGYLSDKMGHKQALVMARVMMLVSTLFYLLASNFFFLVLGGIFLSASRAFQSGTGSAFMHDTLRGLGRDSEYAKVMGKISSVGFAVPIILTVLVPFLVEISFRLPFLVSLVVDVVGLIAAMVLVVPPVEQQSVDEIRLTKFRQVVKEGYNLNFFSFAFFSSLIMGALISASMFRAPYQVFLEVPVIWFGVFFGIGRAGASLMQAFSGKIRAKTTIYSFFFLQLVLNTFLFVLLGLFTQDWAVVSIFIILNAFQWGLSITDGSYLLEIIKTSKFKATLLSLGNQMQLLIVGGASFVLGFAIDRLGYQMSFLWFGLIFFIIMSLLYTYLVLKYRRQTNF